MKKTIAVFFGGRSPEHDVSIVSALQVLNALDTNKYSTIPVYVMPDGRWVTGDFLRDRTNYLLDKNGFKQVTEVTFDVNVQGGTDKKGRLMSKKTGMMGSAKIFEFDVAMPVFHGLHGEDGDFQGLCEIAGVPYVGTRVLASSVFMDKIATKRLLKALDIPHLPYAILRRPNEGYMIPRERIHDLLGDLSFPLIIKPVHLGSSIGVAKCESLDDILACLPAIFEYDDSAIVEPAVKNLVEYNVAVTRVSGEIRTSAIERPKASKELLDFKQKYLSGSKTKTGTKTPGESSQGMLSLTRELNPPIDQKSENNIRAWAQVLFAGLDGTGAPRIDYLCDSKSSEIWLNEVNPCPGSYGYFLWEAAREPLLFGEFLSLLIDEALSERRKKSLPKDPVPVDARLHKRPLY